MLYKKFLKDWDSPDGRFHYKKGDEELVIMESTDNTYFIAADIGIVFKVPTDIFEEEIES